MIKVAIAGYGNLGRGVDVALNKSAGMRCVGIFTRRNPEDVKSVTGSRVYSASNIRDFKNETDVLVLCGGSACDLPQTAADLLKDFNTVDTFDTHAKIPAYSRKLDETAKKYGKTCMFSVGWDPGLFSAARLLFDSVLKDGKSYTFWGKGVSQGHSNAVKEIPGVKRAIAYTVPRTDAVRAAFAGENRDFTAREKHYRECYVVLDERADENRTREYIKSMPNYFSDYDTNVYFVSEEEFLLNHTQLPHGGDVIRSGITSAGKKTVLEFSLKTDSNPEFTGGIAVAAARAAYRLSEKGYKGAFSVFDVPLKYFSDKDDEYIRKTFL